jgi:hypothetical protein
MQLETAQMKKLLIAALIALSSTAFAATLSPVSLINPAGSTSGQVIRSTGPTTAPAWGNVTAANLAAQAGNTVLANFTAASASPTAFAMPSCSTSTSALQYTSGTGFTCNAGVAPSASPSLTGVLTITNSATSGGTIVVNATGNTGSGAAIVLGGNGVTTPNKFIRAFNGAFQVVNSTNSATPMSMDDAGNVVFSGSVTGTAGSFTTLSASGLISPSSTVGIKGTTAADNANAGSIGEFLTATGTGVSLTSGTTANITSIVLTAGDWDVSGNVEFISAAGTIISIAQTAVTTTTGANGANGIRGINSATQAASNNLSLVAPVQRFNVSGSTTVFLTATASFSTSTLTATGVIRARRVR